MNTASKYVLGATALALLALGFGAGRWLGAESESHEADGQAASRDEQKVLYWYDPMYPQQHFDQPGKSPFMDMALVPRYADAPSANSDADAAVGTAAEIGRNDSIRIAPQRRQTLGIRLARVERAVQPWAVTATGLLAFNERDLVIEQLPVDGLVERIWPLAAGDRVRAGQALLAVRAPDWTAAQQEWLVLRAHGDAGLLAAAEQRLQQLGIPTDAIAALKQQQTASETFLLRARRAGVIQSVEVRAGMRLMSGQTLLRINGLDTVWLDIAIPEAQAAGLSLSSSALTVTASLTAFPGEQFAGGVVTVQPSLDDASRSLRLRVEFANHDGRLRPGMTAQVSVQARSELRVLTVPTEALIRTGKRTLAILAKADRFQPVEVQAGRESGDHSEILAGLNEGDQIVLSGQFLLDSEASLAGVLARSIDGAELTTEAATKPSQTTPRHEADARVKALSEGSVTLAHGPFTTLGMPGMTMSFPLANAHVTHDIAVGDDVRVVVREQDDGLVVVELIKQEPQP